MEDLEHAISGFGFLYAAIRLNLATGHFRGIDGRREADLSVPVLRRAIALGSTSPLALGRVTVIGAAGPSGPSESAI